MNKPLDIEPARRYAEYHGVKPWTEHIFALVAEVERLRDVERVLGGRILQLTDEAALAADLLTERGEFDD